MVQGMTPVYCSVCGREVRGPHPQSCNGPNQKFLTREEMRRNVREIRRPKLSAEEWRRLRDEQIEQNKRWILENREDLLPL